MLRLFAAAMLAALPFPAHAETSVVATCYTAAGKQYNIEGGAFGFNIFTVDAAGDPHNNRHFKLKRVIKKKDRLELFAGNYHFFAGNTDATEPFLENLVSGAKDPCTIDQYGEKGGKFEKSSQDKKSDQVLEKIIGLIRLSYPDACDSKLQFSEEFTAKTMEVAKSEWGAKADKRLTAIIEKTMDGFASMSIPEQRAKCKVVEHESAFVNALEKQ